MAKTAAPSINFPKLHLECIAKAKYWLKNCNGSRAEAKHLLNYPSDFNNEDDIRVLQTVLALGEQ